MANKKLRIWCYDTEGDALYELYNQKNIPTAYDSADRIVDARSYPENGTDVLYFTDNYHELRKIRCEIPTPYTASFLSDYDLSLQRYGANGTINFNLSTAIASGGTLLSGTYQFAYRLINPTTNVYTKWSSLTNPVHVYNKISTTYALYASGYGLATDRKVVFSITPSFYELEAIADSDLTHFQVAVVENINQTAASLEASLLSVDTISLVGNSINYEYKANYNIGKISIDEIVVDSAAIETAKTIAISQNRLFAGNIQYTNLELDNGTPQLDDASATNNEFITYSRENDVDLALEKDLSFRKGYFRGEVYRFAIVYFDKYGNKSAPQVLDMTDVTGNNISGATDIKFPERGSSYPILNSSNNPVNIGLKLKLKNHPSWAVGFEIVREGRIKKVIYQSPVIPMMSVKGVGAIETYPVTPTIDGAGTTATYSSAQPQISSEVYTPKNLLWPELRNITLNTTTTGSGATRKINGESKLTNGSDYNMALTFPQESIYEAKDATLSGVEQVKTVDYVLAKANQYNYNILRGITVDGADGDNAIGEYTTTLYGLENNFYHSSSGSYSTSLPTSSIVDSTYVENSASGTFLGGQRIMTYSDLQTQGYEFGYKAGTQRTIACKLKDSFADEGSASISFPYGNHNAYNGGSYIVGSSGPKYRAEAIYTNEFVVRSGYATYSSSEYYTTNNSNDPFQVIRIANIVNPNTGDDRYGDKDSQRSFISTGTKYVFSEAELETYITKSLPYSVSVNVWGGDCCVTSHVFKVCDSTYAVANQNKHSIGTFVADENLVDRWKYCFKISGYNSFVSLPVGLKGNAQHVQVFLESEYNGQALDVDILNAVFASHAVKGKSVVLNAVNLTQAGSIATEGRSYIKSNLNYTFNKNLLVNNEQKTYLTLPDGFNTQYDFGARIHYSDIKIYNSSNQGFDTFRVLNFYDLEELGGNITKLALAGDNMFAIQDKRIVYLPVGNRQIETADSGILAVGTSSVLSQARIVDPLRGGQHLAAIVEAGAIVLIPDKINKAIYELSGTQIKVISDSTVASTFRGKFGTVFVEKNLRGVYDPVRKEYWILSNTDPKFCLVYNFGLDSWITNYEFDSATLYGGRYTNQNLYLVGKVGSQVAIYSMYTGEYTNLMGTEVTPRVTFVVNPDGDYAKTFDDVMISASERLENIDFVVDREQSMGDQTVSEVNLDVFPVEGNYRIKTLRDPRNERLRGLRMKSTIRWKKNNIASTLTAVYTKYRLSSRTPF